MQISRLLSDPSRQQSKPTAESGAQERRKTQKKNSNDDNDDDVVMIVDDDDDYGNLDSDTSQISQPRNFFLDSKPKKGPGSRGGRGSRGGKGSRARGRVKS